MKEETSKVYFISYYFIKKDKTTQGHGTAQIYIMEQSLSISALNSIQTKLNELHPDQDNIMINIIPIQDEDSI